ncbi:unnamed protein product [Rotaria sp. Silwood1]|nr:unnamed protein product [Rotaria sp. Silwood1]
MTEKSSANGQTSEQQSTATITTCLGIGRGKAQPETNNYEQPSVSKWNSTDGSMLGGHSSNSVGGFGSRSGGSVGGRSSRSGDGRFGSDNDGVKACYNCNKIGHIRRDCPELRKENRGGRGGFHLSNDSRKVKFILAANDGTSSMRITNRNSKNPNENNQVNNIDTKPTSGGRFRGNRDNTERGFNSSDHDKIKLGHRGRGNHHNDQSRDYPKRRKPHASIVHYIPPPPSSTAGDIYYEELREYASVGSNDQTINPCISADKIKPIKLFQDALLNTQVLSNIHRAHFEKPTPIQRYTIPCIQQQNDLMTCTQTKSACLLSSGHDMSTTLQKGCHILSTTIDCLKDMVEKHQILLRKIKYVVFVEADRMFNQDFERDIRKLEELGLPQKDKRFTSIFSDTFSQELQNLAAQYLCERYIFLSVNTNEDITHTIEEVRQADKKDRLLQLLAQNLNLKRCLIFVETIETADYIETELTHKNLMSVVIHDDQHSEALQGFTNGKYQILIATSIAACNLDFSSVDCVIHYDLPDSIDFYIDQSISFFDPDRISDRKIAAGLLSKLTEMGQEAPEFLKQYAATSDDTTFSNTVEEDDEDEWEDEED